MGDGYFTLSDLEKAARAGQDDAYSKLTPLFFVLIVLSVVLSSTIGFLAGWVLCLINML